MSISSVPGSKLPMVTLPKLAANTKLSPAMLVAAGDAGAVVVLPCGESLVAGCGAALATTVFVGAVGEVSPAEFAAPSAVAASVALGSADATKVEPTSDGLLWPSLWN